MGPPGREGWGQFLGDDFFSHRLGGGKKTKERVGDNSSKRFILPSHVKAYNSTVLFASISIQTGAIYT